jgi:MarR family transcriptional regulator, organic hydroperoxide resistance regulator
MQTEQNNLGFLLVQLARAHRNRLDSALDKLNLSVGQEHAIYQLARQANVPQAQLAHSMFIDPSTATKMLARLERNGVIQRSPDPTDGRVSLVSLTPYGQTLVQPVIATWDTIETQLRQGMTDAEQALLRRLLVQMVQNLISPAG